ncbi:MAG: hypothetical protein A2452_07600 [Candidatus Firestonebacteria bacterium RIFOXYC2_FULL_39_67]|nr:MAG: hypothetical protein A2536_01505 [Candidatus Firestonebacteria bacterium RIFOXYD2_FULL_39_29]OGF52964.1 MAG: hypothetical protein A2497_00185 [Candidatus Firestonebacteria bacterium RifOxyC12_full_39_7]OGF55516.1 MAG: hypothetical protein A2452_07600 [Candidatus Firestonebacteria bacterium RIFOXYC2_FULL_39_67]
MKVRIKSLCINVIVQAVLKTTGVSPWMKKPRIINRFRSQEDSKGGYSFGLGIAQVKKDATSVRA